MYTIDNCLGCPSEVMDDKNIVKVFNGIAGAAKSSAIHEYFTHRGIEYCRCVSTNKLKNDAERRFNCPVNTIASGLFKTDRMIFYAEEKEIAYDNVVIDEVLQTSKKVFDWVKKNVGNCNIILCTDDRQMLSPYEESAMKKAFRSLLEEEYVYEIRLTETKRAIDDETRKCYEIAYYGAVKGKGLFYQFLKPAGRFSWMGGAPKVIEYGEMEYNTDDVFICHTLDIEKMVYFDNDLCNRYDCPLIAKGAIASKKVKDVTRYPIVPQVMAESSPSGYMQIANVCTPTRYQGSEIEPGQTLYYVLHPKSQVSNREFYTTITRCKTISSLVIVWADKIEDDEPLTEFNGKPVYQSTWLSPLGSEMLDGRTIEEWAKVTDGKIVEISAEEFLALIAKNRKDGEYLIDSSFWYNGKKFVVEGTKQDEEVDGEIKIQNLLAKEPMIRYDYNPMLMRLYEKAQARAFKEVRDCHFIVPYVHIKEPRMQTPFPDIKLYEDIKQRSEYRFFLDLKAAYPHAMCYGKIPTGARISMTPKKDGWINWYMCLGRQSMAEMAMVTEDLKRELEEYKADTFEFVCATSYQNGSNIGNKLHGMAHRSVEHMQRIKSIKYGYCLIPYIEQLVNDSGDIYAYYCNGKSLYQLFILSLVSSISEVMIKIRKRIYGLKNKGFINVDCIYFDTSEDIQILAEDLRQIAAPYDFRIGYNRNNLVFYETFDGVKSYQNRKKNEQRERRKQVEGQINLW